MISGIAMMIAVYGIARLLNDGFARHPGNNKATDLTWTVSIIASILLFVLVVMVNCISLDR